MNGDALRFASPPRYVPISLRALNYLNIFALIGWFLLAFSSPFFWLFAGNADLSVVTFRGAINRAQGWVTSIRATNASEGGSKGSSGTRIYANHYMYSVAGRSFEGVSYSLGQSVEPGSAVEVEYLSSDPSTSRVAGMRRSIFGPWAVVVLIFPLIGLLFVYFSTRSGGRRNLLLRHGHFTTGVLKGKSPTNMRVNNHPVYELTFAFQAYDGSARTAKARSHYTARLEDEAREPLLYDPEDPDCAYLLDEVPARPRFDADGQIVGRPVAAAFALILPLLVIGGNALVVLYKMKIVTFGAP